MNEIRWTLTVDEANFIFAVLGERPHKEVFRLMHKLQLQSQPAPKVEDIDAVKEVVEVEPDLMD